MTNCDCNNNGIKAYFKLDYKPNKLSQLANDTHYVDINDVLDEINTHNTSETAHTYIQGRIDATNTTIGDLTELDTSVKTSVVDAINSEVSARGNADTALENDYNAKIGTLSDLDSSVKTDVVSAINSVISDEATIVGDLDDLDTSVKTSIVTAINSEVSDRQSADSGLQTQIDALAASSDVTDIVGTYAELQAYDTQHLNDNDIIKVLDDSTHNDAPSYYRYNKSTDSFTYIGSESASYTKAESDTLFVPQTRTVNSKALSADITLTSSDVGALASTTTINDLTTTAQQNALNSGATTTNIGQIATNTSSISTINGKIPSDASSSNKLVTASALSNAVVNLADKDLSNLTETGEERLHALKSYSDNGELLTDAEGLSDITKYAHSTFDLSKFTSVGTPTITNGVLSNITRYDYLECPSNLVNATNYTINVEFELDSEIGGSYGYLISDKLGTSTRGFGIGYINKSATQATLSVKPYSGSAISLGTINTNTPYKLSFVVANNTARVMLNGTQIGNDIDATGITWSDTLVIGNRTNDLASSYFTGKIDLKQFSITVDGVEVFSGNKTGIDTIKPDDYTVVGTPTISADGVASGFSSSNYLTTNTISSKNFKLQLPVNFGSNPFNSNIYFLFVLDTNNAEFYTLRCNSGNIQLSYKNTSNANIYWTIADNTFISANTNYLIEIETNGSNISTKVTNIDTDTSVTNSASNFNSANYSNIGLIQFGRQFTYGSIDLNYFKIYVDGNLVYQPCLKIPYTESKTGSKIVNAIYRDRVNDMAEQFGYANYYTLSDIDFTLPQSELYGLIGDKTLRDSYYNGVTYWELFSNRRLEQGGSCESGVEYTLPKPFADANYVLTIPYSSKTATSFIPSATGDFIAKGTGLL